MEQRSLEERARESGRQFRGAPYYDVAEPGMERQWSQLIWPFIQDADFSSVIDLAAGHGRNSAYLLNYAKKLIIIDINDDNIEFCRRRFGDDPRVSFLVNDGMSLQGVPDESVTLVYTFDSMVHFDSDVVRGYLREFRRVLCPGGHAFVHHSNYTGQPGGVFTDSPHWRNFMSRELFAHYSMLEGLEVVRQQVIDWSEPDLDCLSLLRRPDGGTVAAVERRHGADADHPSSQSAGRRVVGGGMPMNDHPTLPDPVAIVRRALLEACTEEDWRRIVHQAVQQAKAGQPDAWSFLAHCLGTLAPPGASDHDRTLPGGGNAAPAAAGSGAAGALETLDDSARADLIKDLVTPFMLSGKYRDFFGLWEQHGFHITPNDHYQPVPDTRTLTPELWERESSLAGIDMNEDGQLRLARDVFARYSHECRFPDAPTDTPYDYHFNNGMFNDHDPIVLHSLIRHHNSKLVVEVGSGYSTRVIARAARMNGSTEVIVIDRYPGDVVRQGIPGVSRLIAADVQQADPAIFERLGAGDILFVDTSHVVRCASEVNYLFFEVFPRLKPGVMVHIHDIFFPRDYPRSWLVDLKLFWTEQYLLQAFLTFNSAFQVLFCNSFMAIRHGDEMHSIFPQSPHIGGTSFWMVRQR